MSDKPKVDNSVIFYDRIANLRIHRKYARNNALICINN